MKRTCRAIVFFVFALFVRGSFAADVSGVFYVSTAGRDTWSGQLAEANAGGSDGPFATLERARDAVRSLKKDKLPAGGVGVYVRGGVYPLSRTFELSGADSGSVDAPIVYRAFGDEEVRLVGGVEVGGFGPITDGKVLERIDEKYRGKILQVDLKAVGVGDLAS